MVTSPNPVAVPWERAGHGNRVPWAPPVGGRCQPVNMEGRIASTPPGLLLVFSARLWHHTKQSKSKAKQARVFSFVRFSVSSSSVFRSRVELSHRAEEEEEEQERGRIKEGRERTMAAAAEGASAGAATATGKMVMVVGVDESDHSYYALQWALNHFFPPNQTHQYRLIVVTAKPTAASAVGLAGPGAADVLPIVEADLKKSAMRVIDKAKELCAQHQVGDAVFEVAEGDARNVLCDAVERHHAEMLAVGSHGYGAIKRAVLGSVSDYCAHHAHCTVMIVKKPKQHKH